MTLGNLTRNTTVQGDVHLSLWRCGELVADELLHNVDDLDCQPKMGLWKRMNISYIFAAADGLHIDFETED